MPDFSLFIDCGTHRELAIQAELAGLSVDEYAQRLIDEGLEVERALQAAPPAAVCGRAAGVACFDDLLSRLLASEAPHRLAVEVGTRVEQLLEQGDAAARAGFFVALSLSLAHTSAMAVDGEARP